MAKGKKAHWATIRVADARVNEMQMEVLFLKDHSRRLKDEVMRVVERIQTLERNIKAEQASVR